ncbi:MAG: pyruvate dehydrogenase (acetyl-transferring) E1 component subunit alpha, partial [Chloroflexi bacterium]|nr:pyruvate dehydrogenase (acetyl-transferring) E1 component subunit alpha [Chloroflexota bacterium]
GHSMGDQRAYRTPDEMHKWQAEDSMGQFEHVLLKQGIAAATIDAIDDEVRQTIAEAIRFADESPFPADEEIWTDIYAGASR